MDSLDRLYQLQRSLTRRGFLGSGLAGMMGSLVGGLSTSQAAQAFAGAQVSASVGPSGSAIAIFIAQQAGYFKAAQIDMKIQPERNSALAIQLMAGGQTQLASPAAAAFLNNAVLRGADIILVSSMARVSGKHENTGIVVSDKLYKEGVRSIQDLRGREIHVQFGIDSSVGKSMKMALEEFGVAEDEVKFKNWFRIPQMQQAILAGIIDVAILLEPNVSLFQKKAGIHPIYFADQLSDGDHTQVLAMPREWVEQNEEATIRLLVAYLRAIQIYQEAQASGWTAHPVIKQTLMQVIGVPAEIIDGYQGVYYETVPFIDLDIYRRQISTFVGRGIQTLVPPEEYVEMKYLRQAADRLGLA
ncbi:MAG: ABC transporter substrate-binding protein [Acidobacteriota bacterium]|nr:ABC transporter substrate-binding protein [Acidobacteriota bacterium]